MHFSIDLTSFIRDILLIILSWFFMTTAFTSWGGFLTRIIGINISGKKGFFANIWLGWCFCLFFFAVYHLFLPINAFASALFYFPAIIYFFIKYGKKLWPAVKSIDWLKISAIVLVAIAAAAVAIQIPLNYDGGLYHMNSIRWANEHHIIKGIGNLHTRLGFNQLYFLYAASLNFHPYLNDYAFHTANSFLYIIFAAGMIMSGTFIDLLLFCLFFFLPMPYYWIAEPTPDIASLFLQIIAFRYFIDVVHYKNCEHERSSYIGFVAIIAALLVAVKLSNIVFASGMGLIAFLYCYKNPLEALEKKTVRRSLVFLVIFAAIWVVRGYIQSGYPVFPSSAGRIAFDWTVPERMAKYTETCVYVGSRTGGQIYDPKSPVLQDGAWFDFWVKDNFFNEQHYLSDDLTQDIFTWLLLIFFPITMFNWGMGSITLLVISALLVLAWLRALFRQKNLFVQTDKLFYLLLVDAASILFWFLVAPEVRFANGLFIILFIVSLMMIKTAYPKLNIRNDIKKLFWFFPVFMFIWAFYVSYSIDEFRISGMVVLNKLPMKNFVTDSGLTIYVPVKGDQCWDSALPSTPEPEKGLALLGSTLDEGFCMKE